MTKRAIFRLSAMLTLALGCGAAPEPSVAGTGRPIINGTDSTEGLFPTVTGLLLDALTIDSTMPLMPKCVHATGACTGTLIREDVILTAGHCISNLFKDLMAPGCSDTLQPPRYSFEVDLIGAARAMRVTATAKAVAHPMFAPTMCKNPPDVDQWNDIALVFLKDPIKGAPIQKLARPADAATLKEGDKVRIVGYGKSVTTDDKTAGTQRWGTATLTRVGMYELVAGQMGEQQACQGDSGGPIFANPDGPVDQLVQIGVTSRLHTLKCPSLLDLLNPPKCENGAFYTRVDAYYDWIQQTIAMESPTPPGADMTAPDGGAGGTDQGGCQCDVGGHGAPPLAPLLLLGGLLLGRLVRRRRGAR